MATNRMLGDLFDWCGGVVWLGWVRWVFFRDRDLFLLIALDEGEDVVGRRVWMGGGHARRTC